MQHHILFTRFGHTLRPLLVGAVMSLLLSACPSKGEDVLNGTGVTVRGMVADGICTRLEGAVITLLDTDQKVTSTAEGAFQFDAVEGEVIFQVTANATVPTLSAVRNYTEDIDNIEVAAIPESLVIPLHLLAGAFDYTIRSTVVVPVLNANNLPIAGATVRLLNAAGDDVGERRYLDVDPEAQEYKLNEQGNTSARSATAIFFDVPDGDYRVEASREDWSFKALAVRVRAGAITFDRIIGTPTTPTPGGITPVVVDGDVWAAAPFPEVGPIVPRAGVQVSLWLEDDSVRTTTTDAEGAFRFELDFTRRFFDVTYEGDTYGAQRTEWKCAESPGVELNRVLLQSSFDDDNQRRKTLGSTPIDRSAGWVSTYLSMPVDNVWTSIDDATANLIPDVAPAYYGQGTNPGQCAVGLCSDGCGDTERCEAGECVRGTVAPVCGPCNESACPEGFTPANMPSIANEAAACYCVLEQDDCEASCQAGTYCEVTKADVEDVWVPGGGLCQPNAADMPTLSVDGRADYGNVPPGIYRLTGMRDGLPLKGSRVRVSAGVRTTGWTGLRY